MSRKFYLILFLVISIITSCSKNVADTENNNTTNKNRESTKLLFALAAADSTTTIKSYTPSFNSLWSMQLNGTFVGYNYIDGSFYVTTQRINLTTYKGTYFFYCLDAKNGAIKWSVNSDDQLDSPVPVGSTLYCGGYNNGSRLIAFDPNNGEVLSKASLHTQYGMAHLESDDDQLYFLYVTPDTDYKVACYSTSKKNITWSQSIGISFGNSLPRPILYKDKVFIQTNAGTLKSFDKDSGYASWTVKGSNFFQPMVGQENVCAIGQYSGYYGYDNITGEQKWFNPITKNLFIPSIPYMPAENIFFVGKDATNWALYSLSAGTGVLNYKKNINDELKKLTAVGSDLYGVYDNTATNSGFKLMLLSSEKGIAKDSILIAAKRFNFGILTSANKFVTYR